MPTTALPAISISLASSLSVLVGRLELVLDLARARDLHGYRADRVSLIAVLHRPAQRDDAVDRDDLDVMRGPRQRVVGDDRLADLLGELAIGLALGLVSAGRPVVAIADVAPGVVRLVISRGRRSGAVVRGVGGSAVAGGGRSHRDRQNDRAHASRTRARHGLHSVASKQGSIPVVGCANCSQSSLRAAFSTNTRAERQAIASDVPPCEGALSPRRARARRA